MLVYLAHRRLLDLACAERLEPAEGFYDRWRASTERQAWWLEVCAWVGAILAEPIYWQRVPTFRHVRAGTPGYAVHAESDFGHNPHTINLWAPLVVTEARALRVGNHWTRPMGPGELVLFPGGVLHGSPDAVDDDRTSIDARFLIERDYRDTLNRSAVAGVRLAVGAYYGAPDELPPHRAT